MESYAYPQLSVRVHIALFNDAKNAASVRKRIVAAATMEGAEGDAEREAISFAFVNASLIASRLHLQTAVYQAVLADLEGSLRTKTVHSEILWVLSPTHNITEAIRRFGVSDASTALFVVRVAPPELESSVIESQMRAIVDGTLVDVDEVENVTDWGSLKKYYKLNEDAAVKALSNDPPRERAMVNEIVISTVAMKSVSA